MSYGSMRKQLASSAQPAAPAFSNRCHAEGCPCRGTISVEGGKFCCAAHAFVPADRWPGVSEKLRDHDWLIGFIDDIKKMRGKCENWRTFAQMFWDGQDEFCLPHDRENFEPYENRMRGELLYRCGLSKRPAVRLPQEVTRRGNVGSLLGARA